MLFLTIFEQGNINYKNFLIKKPVVDRYGKSIGIGVSHETIKRCNRL